MSATWLHRDPLAYTLELELPTWSTKGFISKTSFAVSLLPLEPLAKLLHGVSILPPWIARAPLRRQHASHGKADHGRTHMVNEIQLIPSIPHPSQSKTIANNSASGRSTKRYHWLNWKSGRFSRKFEHCHVNLLKSSWTSACKAMINARSVQSLCFQATWSIQLIPSIHVPKMLEGPCCYIWIAALWKLIFSRTLHGIAEPCYLLDSTIYCHFSACK